MVLEVVMAPTSIGPLLAGVIGALIAAQVHPAQPRPAEPPASEITFCNPDRIPGSSAERRAFLEKRE
jgi:hypothetical protein